MAPRILAPLAGASLLALASDAGAQDHAPPAPAPQTPPAPPSPRPDLHAGHVMGTAPRPQAAPMDHTAHAEAGMDHDDPAMPMTSALGAWPMSRDASGASRQPDLSERGGVFAYVGLPGGCRGPAVTAICMR